MIAGSNQCTVGECVRVAWHPGKKSQQHRRQSRSVYCWLGQEKSRGVCMSPRARLAASFLAARARLRIARIGLAIRSRALRNGSVHAIGRFARGMGSREMVTRGLQWGT